MESFYANALGESDDGESRGGMQNARPAAPTTTQISFAPLAFLFSAGRWVLFASKSVSPADKSLWRFLSYGTSEAPPLLIFNESKNSNSTADAI
jgi:hypothetical protein